MSSKFAQLSIALTLVVGLAACSDHKDDANAAAKPDVRTVLTPGTAKSVAAAAKAATLPQPDANTPDSSYVKLTSGKQLMFLYAADSGMPPDFDKMAMVYSNDYRSTSDSFRKHDLLTAITPKLQAGIADAKAHPYIVWDADAAQLQHYDFTRKGFVTQNSLLDDGGFGYFYDASDYHIAFSNGSQFKFLPVADDAKAREIEAMISGYKNLRLRIFAFVQSTDDSSVKVVQAVITKVQVLDGRGDVLIEQLAKKAS